MTQVENQIILGISETILDSLQSFWGEIFFRSYSLDYYSEVFRMRFYPSDPERIISRIFEALDPPISPSISPRNGGLVVSIRSSGAAYSLHSQSDPIGWSLIRDPSRGYLEIGFFPETFFLGPDGGLFHGVLFDLQTGYCKDFLSPAHLHLERLAGLESISEVAAKVVEDPEFSRLVSELLNMATQVEEMVVWHGPAYNKFIVSQAPYRNPTKTLTPFPAMMLEVNRRLRW